MQSGTNCLTEMFVAHGGKAVDKWEHYLAIYARELAPSLAAGKPLKMLEIGVQNGGSLELWAQYLPAGSHVCGIDIDPKVAALRFDADIEVLTGDAGDPAALAAMLGPRMFDVIIDDGSHQSRDIIATFKALFGRLAPGGKFIIEDLHASYWPDFGGGLGQTGAAIEYLKYLADALHADYLGTKEVAEIEGQLGLPGIGRWLASVTFYDSVAVIEKLPAEKTAPYRRVLSGANSPVQDQFDGLISQPAEAIAPMLLSEPRMRQFEAALLARLEQMRDGVEALMACWQAAEAQRDQAREDLRILQASSSWRVTAPLRLAKRVIRAAARRLGGA